jgi:hypothetical protein
MNPYLERESLWHGFHDRLCAEIANSLVPQVRPNYIVDIGEHVYVHENLNFVKFHDRESRVLVAAIEVLSPINKQAGADREQYLRERRQYLQGSAHFVELDLLRGWPRLPLEGLPDCDYYALVSRVEERPRVGVWPIRLRDPLPCIPIPLRPTHADARIDLQEMLHRIHDAAGYEDYIYSGMPQPPLHPSDEAWARDLIARRAQAK